MKKKGLGIVYKLIGMSALPVIVLGAVLSIYGLSALKNNLKEEIKEGLKSAAVAVQGAYDAAGAGDFVHWNREISSRVPLWSAAIIIWWIN